MKIITIFLITLTMTWAEESQCFTYNGADENHSFSIVLYKNKSVIYDAKIIMTSFADYVILSVISVNMDYNKNKERKLTIRYVTGFEDKPFIKNIELVNLTYQENFLLANYNGKQIKYLLKENTDKDDFPKNPMPKSHEK